MREDRGRRMSAGTGAEGPVPVGAPGNPPVKAPDEPTHWLAKPETIRAIRISFGVVLALTVAGDLFVHHREHFGIDATFGFSAWYGFATCVGMVVVARALGTLLKRRDDYYETEAEE